MISLKDVALLLSVFVLGSVLAQSTSVICNSRWSWMSNSLGQNPCLIAAYLESICLGSVNIPPYSNTTSVLRMYSVPQGSQANNCTCNTVLWALVEACLVCQDVMPLPSMVNWSTWISAGCASNDNTIHIGQFSEPIPNQTVIPHWAFYNYTTGSALFNATIAEQLGDSPESTNTSSSNQSSSQDNVAQIVACVIGGIAAFVGISMLFLLRHSRARQRRNEANSAYMDRSMKPVESPAIVSSRLASWETLSPYGRDSWHLAPISTPLYRSPMYAAQRHWSDGDPDSRYYSVSM